jgi:5-methylcytosine-specific restriction endonuclease McrA
MPKQCIEPDCTNNQFGGGYCKFHQYKRKLATKKHREYKYTQAKQKAIKTVSDKRKTQLKLYEQAKQEKITELKAQNSFVCFFCGVPFGEQEQMDCHHLHGRKEDSVFDKKYLVFVHRHCHTAYHNDTYSRLSANRWYNSFVERLKEIDPELYNKELKKKDK